MADGHGVQVWLAKLYSNPHAARGFQWEYRGDGESWSHPSTGSWWRMVEDELRKDKGPDSCLAPVILYSDRTTIDSAAKRSGYPVMASLANYSWDMYASNMEVIMIALLPVLHGVAGHATWAPGSRTPSARKREI